MFICADSNPPLYFVSELKSSKVVLTIVPEAPGKPEDNEGRNMYIRMVKRRTESLNYAHSWTNPN